MTTFDEKALEAAYKAFEDAEQLPFGALPTINWSNNDRTKQKIKIAIRTYLSHLPASPAAGELREDVLDTAMRALERAKEKTNALACGFWAPDQNELSSAMAGEASHIFDYIEEAQANVARAAGLSPSDPDKIFNEAIEAVFNFFDPPDTTTKIGDREYKVTHDPYCKLVGIWAAIKERCFDNLEVDELQKLANEILEIQRKIRSLKRPTQPDKG